MRGLEEGGIRLEGSGCIQLRYNRIVPKHDKHNFELEIPPQSVSDDSNNTSPSEGECPEFNKNFEKYLDLDRGTFSNVKVNGQEITFKVNPNVKGLNASEVAVKAGK
ncbi:hypothetical protein CEXT_312421 [Caerostris extrusa]|uniref:Protein-tyrosine phosphatase receptor IA-2 ectodomain domain-containing protein n=1 Tax=Caerostris extrusa TaxID=172846 RepID=A0AAV4VLS1_CAEEX|nr:hypothetical protein CEXT_312421 [Caerostris extrusa]